jgi:GH24 family phage-related lysozyme (muramidase)
MKTSEAGLTLIKEFEGLRLRAYKCPAGVWTIGYGHTSAAGAPKVVPDLKISEAQAERMLRDDLTIYEASVRGMVSVELAQGQFDALVSFAYNCGVGALARSTLLKRVNSAAFDQVPAEFMKWTKAGGKDLPGLLRRRRAEVKLWRDLQDHAPVTTDESRAAPDAPVPTKSITQSREANGAVIAGAGGAAAIVQEVLPALREGSDLVSSLSPTAIICLLVVAAAIAVWWFRKQRLEEEGA